MVRAVSSDALSPLSSPGPLWTVSVTSNPRARRQRNCHNGHRSGGAASSPEAGKGVQMEIILNSLILALLSHTTSWRPSFSQAPVSLSELEREQIQSPGRLYSSVLSSSVPEFPNALQYCPFMVTSTLPSPSPTRLPGSHSR